MLTAQRLRHPHLASAMLMVVCRALVTTVLRLHLPAMLTALVSRTMLRTA
jgi:hypothetical protein